MSEAQLPLGFERTRGPAYVFESGVVDRVARTATFSPCGRYRYELTRVWSPCLPIGVIVGSNPSSAGAVDDDQTIRKEMGFARRWGWGGFVKLNLDAIIATDPKTMPSPAESVGSMNNAILCLRLTDAPGLVTVMRFDRSPLWPVPPHTTFVAAWGFRPAERYMRVVEVMGLLRSVRGLSSLPGSGRVDFLCLGTTADGSPRHTSRLGYSAQLEPWRGAL
jgi:hypothetical protein